MDSSQINTEMPIINGEDDKKNHIRIESFPSEIILLILSKLPISSLVRFKRVCKAWYALTRDPNHTDFFNHQSVQDNKCIVFHTDYPIKGQLYLRELKLTNTEEDKPKKLQTNFYPSASEIDTVLSCKGLLLLCDSLCNTAYVYNPFTEDYMKLPILETQYHNQKAALGFGFFPLTKEYKIIKIIYYYHKGPSSFGLFAPPFYPKSEVQVLTLGQPVWRILGKSPKYFGDLPSRVLVNGNLHWLSRPLRYCPGREIISFDLVEEQFKGIPKPEGVRFYNSDYLVELNGYLSGVRCLNYGEIDIWVLKEYGVKESWVKEFHIGRYVPKGLEVDLDRQVFEVSKMTSRSRYKHNRVLGFFGDILIEKQGRALVLYDPNSGGFRELVFQAMPSICFETIVHVGRLDEIRTTFGL